MNSVKILIFSLSLVCVHGVIYKSYQGVIVCNSSEPMEYPNSHSQVQKIILRAIKDKKTVKAIGAAHSTTDIICTEGIPINMTKMTNIRISQDRKTVTVDAGVQLLKLIHHLHEHGLTLQHVPAYGGITIGGAMGTGARGSTLKYPNSISQLAIRVHFIDGRGKFRKIKETSVIGKTLGINAIRVHLGLLGVIVNVTLKVVPDYKIKMFNEKHNVSILFDGKLVEMARKADFFQAFWFPHINKVVTQTGMNKRIEEDGGNCETNFIPPVTIRQAKIYGKILEKLQETHNYPALWGFEKPMVDMLTKNQTYNGYFKKSYFTKRNQSEKLNEKERMINPATGFAGFMMANLCDDDRPYIDHEFVDRHFIFKCPWNYGDDSIGPEENAFAINLTDLGAALEAMQGIIAQEKTIFPILGVLLRFSGNFSKKSIMCIENQETVYVEVAVPMRKYPLEDSKLGIAGFQAIGQMLMERFNGRPHWGKNGPVYFSRSRLTKFLGDFPDTTGEFPNLMKEYDPNGIFLNKFGRRLLNLDDAYDVNPEMKHCALQDFCFCTENEKSQCAKSQKCKRIDDPTNSTFKYNVCDDDDSENDDDDDLISLII